MSNKIGFEISIMDTGLALDPGMSTGLAIVNHEIGFGTSNVTDRATHAQDIPPLPTPGLSANLAGMKLSAKVLKGGMSKPTQKSHPQSTQKSIGLSVDECICSARCKGVQENGEPGHVEERMIMDTLPVGVMMLLEE